MVQSDIQISIITINYNGLANTCALIETIPFNDYPLEVIVVDNASTEDEATLIEQRYPQVKVIRSKENLGFAGGNNLGIKAALGRYLFFINNDTILKPQTSDIRHLTSKRDTHPSPLYFQTPDISFVRMLFFLKSIKKNTF